MCFGSFTEQSNKYTVIAIETEQFLLSANEGSFQVPVKGKFSISLARGRVSPHYFRKDPLPQPKLSIKYE